MANPPKLIKHWIRNSSKVAVIELNNTAKRNPLSHEVLSHINRTVQRIESDPSVRVVVIQSKGPVFSSGHDLREIQRLQQRGEVGRKELERLFQLCSDTMKGIVTSKKPFIAKVDGIATAAGCQLVASCDLAYASTRSQFATPGVNLGLFCSTPAVALGRCVGRKSAMEMLLTGRLITSNDAERIGLVNRVVAENELDEVVDDVADVIASKSTEAIGQGKPLFGQQMELSLEEAYALTSERMVENVFSQDCREGIAAFLNKRKPQWRENDEGGSEGKDT